MRRLLLLLAIVIAMAASPVFAGEIEVQTVSVSASDLTDLVTTLNIPQFNAVKGTLLKVTLDVSATLNGYFYCENLSAGPGGYQVNENTWHFVAGLQGVGLVSKSGTMSTPSVLLGAFDGVQDYAGTSGATVPYADTAAATATYFPADAAFAGFQGGATLPLNVSTTIWTSYSTYGGHSVSGLHTEGGWIATVSYEYQPTTVPAGDMTWGGVKTLYR